MSDVHCSDVHCVDNAIAIPVLPVSDETMQFGIYNQDGALCAPALHWRETGKPLQFGDMPPEIGINALPTLPPGIYGGLFFDHFGHFMTESIGRLWAANAVGMASLPIYVFEPWDKIDFANRQGFCLEVLRCLGIDPGRIVKIEQPSVISRLLVPQQKYDWHVLMMSPPEDFVHFLKEAQGRIEHEAENAADLPRKVYVSRALLPPTSAKVAGEQEFERFLETQGYYILRPEQQPLSRQLQIYVKAEKLIFCEGSAAHACTLLPNISAKVAIILRRKDSWLRRQFDGFGKEVTVVDAVVQQRSFGMPTWLAVSTLDYRECSRLLCNEGFIHSLYDHWPSIAEDQEREAVAAYARTIVDDHRFHSFLLAIEAIKARAEMAETRLAISETQLAATEANLQALLASTSWRMTEPLRRLARELSRDHHFADDGARATDRAASEATTITRPPAHHVAHRPTAGRITRWSYNKTRSSHLFGKRLTGPH